MTNVLLKSFKITKILPKPKKDQTCSKTTKLPKYPHNLKTTETPPKLKKLPKYSRNLKIKKCPPKPKKKITKIPYKPKNDKKNPET